MTDLCQSGGQRGADEAWSDAAEAHGQKAISFNFSGFSSGKKRRTVKLTDDELDEAHPWLIRANSVLKRTYPTTDDFVNRLLRRNYFQVKNSTAVYAVAGINGNSVWGGTAWAIEMFKLMNPDSDAIYVYDESQRLWFQWNFVGWTRINHPPRPKGIWTGIGSREIDDAGRDAINKAFIHEAEVSDQT